MFVEGIRVSTLATVLLFPTAGALRGGDKRALIAAAAWLAGFETAYQVTALLMGTNAYPAAAPFLALPGAIVVPFVTKRYGVRPSPPFVLLTAAIWLIWILFGFHANQHETPEQFSAFTEALNVSAKTSWALAYLWGLRTAPRPA